MLKETTLLRNVNIVNIVRRSKYMYLFSNWCEQSALICLLINVVYLGFEILRELGHASEKLRDVKWARNDVTWRRNVSQANKTTQCKVFPLSYDCPYTTPSFDNSPELRHGSGLYVMFWTFFLNLAFFLRTWLLNVYLYANFFFSDNLLDLSDQVIDHALNWKKHDHSSYKM